MKQNKLEELVVIKSITLKNHKLFKNLSLTFDKINIIKGDNGVGKSTILKSIIFATHGEGSGSNLQRLISFGEKSETRSAGRNFAFQLAYRFCKIFQIIFVLGQKKIYESF